MPPAVGYAIAGIAGGLGSVGAARSASGASRRSAEIQGRAADRALAFEQDVERRRREEFDRQLALEQAQFEARERRRAPYRQASHAILRARADRFGIPLGALAAPAPTPTGVAAGEAEGLAGLARVPVRRRAVQMAPSVVRPFGEAQQDFLAGRARRVQRLQDLVQNR